MRRTSLVAKARNLRKFETSAEKILWQELRNNKLGIKFRRQHSIDKYILDFYASEVNLAIELDGAIHNLRANKEYDKDRTEYLYNKYIEVMRFKNFEIEHNLIKVLAKIREKINNLKSPRQ